MWRSVCIIFLLLCSLSTVSASEQYTFEKAEKLKPLVDWTSYGPEVFSLAVQEDKPIFLLLTAPSWCYWCQVYESEDYLFHPRMVEYLNENTIPVYVDADKRQDLTRKYLEGGWPSTTVLTPSGERIFGYSGPRPVNKMLSSLQQAKTFVQTQGFANTLQHSYEETSYELPTEEQLRDLILSYRQHLLNAHDMEHGGFGTGQKFPQARTLDYALDVYEATGDIRYLELVERTLANQYTELSELETNYNLFDPVEGGFHRYGTTPHWSPPHYEKMLYDNARLLKAYQHLRELNPENVQAAEVVEKTLHYVETEYYDERNGGFYSNTDVHGENVYYAKHPRPLPKARVEQTKYTDWNSEAIITFLYLYDKTTNNRYREIADASLTYLQTQQSEAGMYHYHTPKGERGVQGNLLDVSYALLAFTEGRALTEDFRYLESAEKLAAWSLENLYDWKSGGFFERNSPDVHLYAPGEHIVLTKPLDENGIMAFALLQLYEATKNITYLEAGLHTQGWIGTRIGGLDRGYYAIKSAELIVLYDQLATYETQQEQASVIRNSYLTSYWLNTVLENKPFALELEQEPKNAFIVFLLVALIVGILSILSPCTLSILPAYLAYTIHSTKKNILGITTTFFIGLATSFTVLGLSATTIGLLARKHVPTLTVVIGIVLTVLGVCLLFGKELRGISLRTKKPLTYFGGFLFGAAIGISWTPCVGPILVSLLLLAATQQTALQGGILLFTYAVGLGVPLILLAWYLQQKGTRTKLWKILKGKQFSFGTLKIHSTTLVSGLLFIVFGILLLTGTLTRLNQVLVSLPFQELFFSLEELFLRFLR